MKNSFFRGRVTRSLLLAFAVGIFTFLSPAEAGEQIDYTLWNQVLQNYVNDQGLVDYEGLKGHPQALNAFVQQVQNADLDSLTDSEEKAFWINAYNAITLSVVVDKYPVKGIRWINFGLVWEIGRPVAGTKKSLGEIEHDILRPLGDPRIHFAINCASIGCPLLSDMPFYPETLDEQLEEAAGKFINNPEKVRLDKTSNTLYYSAIFDWFEDDFLVVENSLLDYIKKYINPEDKAYLDKHDIAIKVLEYDWGLNKQQKK